MLQVSTKCASCDHLHIPTLCNAWFTNKGTTKKIELCRERAEGGGVRVAENNGVTDLMLLTISSIIRREVVVVGAEGC